MVSQSASLAAIVIVLMGMHGHVLAGRADVKQHEMLVHADGETDALDADVQKPGEGEGDQEVDVDANDLEAGTLTEDSEHTGDAADASNTQDEPTAQQMDELREQKKGKSCCVMLKLPKFVDPVDGSCTAAALETITYMDASRRTHTLPIAANLSIAHPYSKDDPKEVSVKWSGEPYGTEPVERTRTQKKLFKQKRRIAGSTETLCLIRSCPIGYKEWYWSGFRFDTEYTTKVRLNGDKALAAIEGDIFTAKGTRKYITVECYSESFKNEGSFLSCPQGLSSSWSCR